MKTLLSDQVHELESLSNQLNRKNRLLEKQYQELTSQSETLNFQNERLTEAHTLIEVMNVELGLHNRRLEDKVKERTKDLAQSNKLLKLYNENLEQYTFAISHQLKAPVSRVLGLINLLRIVPEAERPIIIESAHGATKELDDIFKQLVHSLNLKSDAAKVKKEHVNIEELIHQTWLKSSNARALSGGVFECIVNGDVSIETDKEHLAEALSHLLDNGIKFTKVESNPRIIAAIVREEEKITIEIQDFGSGFDSDIVSSKLFTPFSRFNVAYPGRGMGLYLAKQHISIIGGEIMLESFADEGTKAKIELPIS
jgi:signal transduction histidine kinase